MTLTLSLSLQHYLYVSLPGFVTEQVFWQQLLGALLSTLYDLQTHTQKVYKLYMMLFVANTRFHYLLIRTVFLLTCATCWRSAGGGPSCDNRLRKAAHTA